MPFKISLLFILIGFIANSSIWAKNEGYLCVAEIATGFIFNKSKDRWEPASSKVDGKYLLNKSSESKKSWEVKNIGESLPAKCIDGFDKHGYIECKGRMDFKMNNKSLRYIINEPYGYVVEEYSIYDEGTLMPYLEIGKCSPL